MKVSRYPLHPILLVDDEIHAIESFESTLLLKGFNNTLHCSESQHVRSILKERKIELILLDLMMPHVSGEEILSMVIRDFPETAVIMVTGINEVDIAVKCMQAGAFDYVLKPVEPDRLVHSVQRVVEINQLRRENRILTRSLLSDSLSDSGSFSHIIARSQKMRSIFQYCEAIAKNRYPVLITGETGTGKELVAEALHKSSRRPGAFIAVNVAGLDDTVFSDTLFGHTRGAFTGADHSRQGLVEKAAGGTLLLDEIGDLSEASQVKLLRLLEKQEYFQVGSDRVKLSDARFIFATNRDIKSLRQCSRFRSDLYYRLRSHHVHMPPLRERPDDIPLLLEHFLHLAAVEFQKKKPTCHRELPTLLKGYHFPGNVRELKAMVFDAVGKHQARMLSSKSFKEYILENRDHGADSPRPPAHPHSFWIAQTEQLPTLKEISQLLIEESMKRSNNNQRLAASMLGISPQTLNKRLKRAAGDKGREPLHGKGIERTPFTDRSPSDP